MTENLINRISFYLASGGLFNPELADHIAVRTLLFECREALAQPERSMKVEGPLHVVCQCNKCNTQPEQEPVGWYDSISGGLDFTFYKPHRKPSSPSAEWIPVYSRPPQRKPLTDKELNLIGAQWHYNLLGKDDKAELFAFARAIEAAHGIKGEA